MVKSSLGRNWTVGINVKNERTAAAVKQLAARYGISYTAAIEMAVTSALREPVASAEQEAMNQAETIAAEYRSLRSATTPLDTAELYDSDGLYR